MGPETGGGQGTGGYISGVFGAGGEAAGLGAGGKGGAGAVGPSAVVVDTSNMGTMLSGSMPCTATGTAHTCKFIILLVEEQEQED